jgi:hypothetical protein
MRLASVVKSSESPYPGSAHAGISSATAISTRKNRDASLFAWVLRGHRLLRALVSERDQPEQDRFHLVKAAHPAINAQPAGPLTGTYKKLSKKSTGKPERSIAVFTWFPSLHFNLFTLLHRRYTLQALVYQGCSRLLYTNPSRRSGRSRSDKRWNNTQRPAPGQLPGRRLNLTTRSGTAMCFHPAAVLIGRSR